MKTIYTLLMMVGLMAGVQSLDAQGPRGGQDVESLKIAFITRRLSLTPEEAKSFWPVYDQYAAEMKEVKEGMRLERMTARMSWDEMSDKEIDATLDKMLELKRKELDITLKYHQQFKSVLSVRKVASLYRAEQEFTRLLLERLQERQENGGGRPGGGPPNPNRRF